MTTNDAPVTVEQALLPFAKAAERLAYYGDINERYSGSLHHLYASTNGGHLLELLNGIDGEPLTIFNLVDAHEAIAALATAPACPASPDHADIMETIQNADDAWEAKGYPSALAEVRDMANVGRALLERIADHSREGPLKGWHPADCPTEVVCDLLNMLADATAPAGDGVAADWLNTLPGVKPSDQFIAADRRLFEGLIDRVTAAALARPRAAVEPTAAMIDAARKAITDRYYAGGKVRQMTAVKPRELAELVLRAALQSSPAKAEAKA